MIYAIVPIGLVTIYCCFHYRCCPIGRILSDAEDFIDELDSIIASTPQRQNMQPVPPVQGDPMINSALQYLAAPPAYSSQPPALGFTPPVNYDAPPPGNPSYLPPPYGGYPSQYPAPPAYSPQPPAP